MNIINKSNWHTIKGKLKEKYGELTDNDLAIAEGQEDQIFGILEKKLGKKRAEIENEIKDWLLKMDRNPN